MEALSVREYRNNLAASFTKADNGEHIIYNISVFIICFILMAHYGIIGTILACTITALYNQSRGFINKNKFKYMFYGFYPIHIIIIFLCQ